MIRCWYKKPGPDKDHKPVPATLGRVAFYSCLFLTLAGVILVISV